MITVPLDEAYFNWLCSQVGEVHTRETSRTHRRILRLLYQKEFVWLIPNDDNRMADGRALRDEFVNELHLDSVDPQWMDLGCSLFEMLLGLSRRVSFHEDGPPSEWFWVLLQNLGLSVYHDRTQIPEFDIDDILDRVIWRQYSPNGKGGLFPLKHPNGDQRKVELWYQMNAYLLENY